MILYLLTDINIEEDKNIKTFLNIFRISDVTNKVVHINNLQEVTKPEDYTVNVCDLGYILIRQKGDCRILICTQNTVKQEDHLKYLNCGFTCKRLNIRLDVVSTVSNPILRQCTIISNGLYIGNTLRSLLSLLGNKESPRVISSHVKCICHNTDVLSGLTCPVCLAVYCKFVPVCKRCKTKFNFVKSTR